MKKLLTLVFVSALGGILTLGSYKLFFEKQEKTVVIEESSIPTFIPTSNALHTTATYAAPDFTIAANNTVHTVVHVKNTAIVSGQPTFEDLFFGRSRQRSQVGSGSGVIISPDGYIITNNHVIADSQELSVTLNNNKSYQAEIIGTDAKTDIALLKINADEDLPYSTFGDSDQAKIGEWVLAVGNPFNLTSTVTAGIISAKARDLSGQSTQSFIQTDAAVNPGNSGGALVNISGELIGINTAISSQTGSYIGYSFAVPSNIARKVIEDIMEFGDVQNGILGVSGQGLNSASAEQLEVQHTEGFYINTVEKNSGAERAGLKEGDVIKKIDNVNISKFSDLKGYLSTKRPDDIVDVTISRQDTKITLPVKLSKSELLSIDFLNMELRNIPKSLKDDYNIDHGVVVSKNNNLKLYQDLGIRSGYIITRLNSTEIDSLDDISKFKQNLGEDIETKITRIDVINRNGQKESFVFR